MLAGIERRGSVSIHMQRAKKIFSGYLRGASAMRAASLNMTAALCVQPTTLKAGLQIIYVLLIHMGRLCDSGEAGRGKRKTKRKKGRRKGKMSKKRRKRKRGMGRGRGEKKAEKKQRRKKREMK